MEGAPGGGSSPAIYRATRLLSGTIFFMPQGTPPRKRRPPKLPLEQPPADDARGPDSSSTSQSPPANGRDRPPDEDRPAGPTSDKSAPPAGKSDDWATEDRIELFLDKAAPVLALERGLNAKSRVKLASVARELGLNDAEFEEAVASLSAVQQKPQVSAEEARAQRRRRRKFQNHIGETLMALPQGILTASMEHMLQSSGVAEFQLTAREAQQEIVQLAKKLHVRRISREEAERHIAEMVDAKIGPDGVLADDVSRRIYAEASRWGLTPDQVEPILKERLSRVRQGERSEQFRTVALVSASAAVLVGVLGLLLFMAFANALPSSDPADPAAAPGEDDSHSPVAVGDGGGGEEDDGSGATAMSRRLGPPDWWDEELELDVALASGRMLSYRDAFYQLRSPDEAARGKAYATLVENARRDGLVENDLAMLNSLLAGAYATEPSDECAARIRQSLAAAAAGPGDEARGSTHDYRLALWAARTTLAALLHEKTSDERGDALASAMGRTLQITVDRNQSGTKLQQRIMSGAAAHLYKSLARFAQASPDLAVDLHREVLPLIDVYLDAAAQERLSTDFLVAVLPALGERWVIYEDLVRRCVQSDNPINVLKMVEVFEETSERALQTFLATQLVLRTGLSRTPPTVDELAAAVRESLGAADLKQPLDNRERLDGWQKAARAAVAKTRPAVEDPAELLQQVVEMARLSTLGAALAQGELGGPEFDDLWREKPPSINGGGSSAPSPRGGASPRISASQLKSFDSIVSRVGNHQRQRPSQTLTYLQSAARFTSQLPDVQPAQGRDLAGYLASAKTVSEHEQLMPLVDGILRWPMVRLALADELESSRLREVHMQQLLERALRRDVELTTRWRDRFRVALLSDVAAEMAAQASLRGESQSIHDRAGKAMLRYYQSQAKLAGVGAGATRDAAAPSDALTLLIEQAQTRLSGSSSKQARELAERTAHELEATDYLVEDDLARTVRLQRVLLRLLAAETSAQAPHHAGKVDELLSQAREQDREATHVLEQLHQHERALLQLWLINNGA